eukprot:Skav226418  [mRNA]  locus=scaffold4012:11991:27643:- [translate_table: standard]
MDRYGVSREPEEAAPNMAFRHLMAVKHLGRVNTWGRGLNLIYMRVFSAGDGRQRAWSSISNPRRQDLSGSRDRRLLHYVILCRLLNAVCTFLIIGWADASIAMVPGRRVSAQCWLVDEDCIFGAVPGRKRQGIIFGALAMTQNFAGAFFSSMTFLGLGLAGLETVNCEAQCKHLSSKVVDTTGVVAECADECFLGVIAQQPDSLRMYVRAVPLGIEAVQGSVAGPQENRVSKASNALPAAFCSEAAVGGLGGCATRIAQRTVATVRTGLWP